MCAKKTNNIPDTKYPSGSDFYFIFLLIVILLTAFFSGGRELISVIATNIVITSVLILFMAKGYWKSRNNKEETVIFGLLIVWLVTVSLSMCVSISRSVSLMQLLILTVYWLIFSSFAFGYYEKKNILISLIVYSASLLSLVGLYFYLTGSYYRLTSTFYWPNPFAGYLLLILPLAICSFFYSQRKILDACCLVLLIGSFILTGSRAAFLSSLIGLFFFLFILSLRRDVYKRIKYNRNFLAALTLLVLLSITLSLSLNFIKGDGLGFIKRINVVENGLDSSFNSKLDYWQAGWEIFKKHPLLGSGPDTFGMLYPSYQSSPINSGKYAHSLYLEMLAENGIVGLAAFIVLVGFIFFVRRKEILADNFKLALAIAIVCFLAHNVIDIDWHFPASVLLFWAILGLLYNNQQEDAIMIDKAAGNTWKWQKYGWMAAACLLLLANIILLASQAYLEQGKEAQAGNDHSDAAELFRKSLSFFKNPESLRSLVYSEYVLAQNENDQGKKKDILIAASSDADELVRIEGVNSQNYLLRSYIHIANGDEEAAEKDLSEAISRDRFNHPEYYRELSNLFIKQKRWQEAKKTVEDILKFYPDNVVVQKMGILYAGQKSMTGIELVISDLYYNLGYIQFVQKQNDLASISLEKAVYYHSENKKAEDLKQVIKSGSEFNLK